MVAFVKNFSQYRTIKQAAVISSAVVLDSLEQETGTVTVAGTGIGRTDIGNWLIIDGGVYWIKGVKPKKDRTMLTLLSPLYAFSRTLEYPGGAYSGIGDFIEAMLTINWVQCSDAAYAVPYLSVSNLDNTGFVVPDLDSDGCFSLSEYAELMRKSCRVRTAFSDGGSQLQCRISTDAVILRQIAFDDGHSQLERLDYASSGTAKITVLQDIDTGEDHEDGTAVTVRRRQDWYLAEDGTISTAIPARRASGTWETILLSESDDVPAKVAEAFARDKSDHKLEFWSDKDIPVHTDCNFYVYGDLLRSYISYKRKSSTDKRFYYKSGELSTTLTDKIRR